MKRLATSISTLGWVVACIMLAWYMGLLPWVIKQNAEPTVVLGIVALPATILPFFRAVFLRKDDE